MKDIVLKVPRHLRRGHRANDERVSIESGVKLIAHMCKHFGLADLGATKLLDIGCGCKFTQAILDNDLPIGEYSARSVKLAVVGTGSASKEQVQMMIVQLLRLSESPAEDAADALAVAICHAHTLDTQKALAGTGVTGYARGRLK